MKYIIIVPDGMADLPVEELGGKTPLDVAHTTNMDYLAAHGIVGEVCTIPTGMHPGSDTGNMSLLGYNPQSFLSGRAPLEAASMGITLTDDEVAFRCNLVTVIDSTMIDYSAGHISTKEAGILIEELKHEMKLPDIRLYTGKSYRHLMVIKTPTVADYLSVKTTPPHDIANKPITKHMPHGGQAERLTKLMQDSVRILENHDINHVRIDLGENPATMIWLWGQGGRLVLPRFKDLYGVDGALISAVDLVNGIGTLAGLEIITVPGATGYYDTDYAGKAQAAIKALKRKDFVFIHIEAPDEAGHNGHVQEKIAAIEKIDKDIVGPILNSFSAYDDVRILVSPDHPTPLALRSHTADPVGFVMYGKGIEPQTAASGYTEKTAQESGFSFACGEEMMKYFISYGL